MWREASADGKHTGRAEQDGLDCMERNLGSIASNSALSYVSSESSDLLPRRSAWGSRAGTQTGTSGLCWVRASVWPRETGSMGRTGCRPVTRKCLPARGGAEPRNSREAAGIPGRVWKARLMSRPGRISRPHQLGRDVTGETQAPNDPMRQERTCQEGSEVTWEEHQETGACIQTA